MHKNRTTRSNASVQIATRDPAFVCWQRLLSWNILELTVQAATLVTFQKSVPELAISRLVSLLP